MDVSLTSDEISYLIELINKNINYSDYRGSKGRLNNKGLTILDAKEKLLDARIGIKRNKGD